LRRRIETSVFPLMIEALRYRPQDILPIAEHMGRLYCRRMNHPNIEFDNQAKSTLLKYAWPGNVRELENVVQRALILQPGNIVGEPDLFLDPMTSLANYDVTPHSPTADTSASLNENGVNGGSRTNHSDGLEENKQEKVGANLREILSDSLTESAEENLEENLKHKEFQIIINVLRKEKGSRNKTAEKLGISARTLRYKLARMRECGIDLHAQLAAY
jgi:two-component system response regulator FlrC